MPNAKLWVFYWQQGGYNHVMAHTRDEAVKSAAALAAHTILTLDEASLHIGTWDEVHSLDRQYCIMD